MTGTYVLSAGYYDAYYLKAQHVRQLINADFMRAFGEVDVLLGPTAPTSLRHRGEGSGSDQDVPQRHLHHRCESGGTAGHVHSLRIRARPAGGRAAHRSAFRRSEAAECGARIPEGNRLAPQDSRRLLEGVAR